MKSEEVIKKLTKKEKMWLYNLLFVYEPLSEIDNEGNIIYDEEDSKLRDSVMKKLERSDSKGEKKWVKKQVD